jgi:hypothetical protein
MVGQERGARRVEYVDLAFTGPPKIVSVPQRLVDSYSNPGGPN